MESALNDLFPLVVMLRAVFPGLLVSTTTVLLSVILTATGSVAKESLFSAFSGFALGLLGYAAVFGTVVQCRPVVARLIGWSACVGVAFMALGVVATVGAYVTDEVDGPAALLAAVGFVTMLWFVRTMARGFFAVSRASSEERRWIGTPLPWFSADTLRAFLGIPQVTRFVPAARRAQVRRTFATGTIVLAGAFISFVSSLALTMTVAVEGSLTPETLTGSVLLFSVAAVCLFASNRAQARARAKVRFSLAQLTEADARPPVLFLRPFRDDQVSLPEPSLSILGRVLSLGILQTNLDTMILEQATSVGPVVALANPALDSAPYGAARAQVDDADWRSAVTDLASRASLIVLCFDDTDAIRWELDLVSRSELVKKVLVLFHPRFREAGANECAFRRVAAQLGKVSQAKSGSLGATPATSSVLGAFVGTDELLHCGTSTRFSRNAYLAMIRAYITAKTGRQLDQLAV